jgi:hypothetical protein
MWDGAWKILKTFFKSIFALVLMTGLLHDPEKGFNASKILKTFFKSFKDSFISKDLEN